MGRDKATLPFAGATMLETLVRRYGAAGEVAVSVDRSGRFDTFGARELVDEYPGLGPLNGLISAFEHTDAERIFMTATDIPNGSVKLAERLLELSEGHDACLIRREDGTLETLFAVYSRACLPIARRSMELGRRSFGFLLESVDARYVGEAELSGFELGNVLRNVNTPEEYINTGGRGMNSIFIRRSIRRFSETPVEPEKIDRIIRAGMQAPSAKNEQPWDFLVITDAEDRLAVSQMSEFAGCAKFAPVLIATLANLSRDERLSRDGDWWAQDMAACTENMLLQAVEEGLGAVWLGFYPYEHRTKPLRKHFGMPDYVMPFSVVAIGYSERENKFVDRYDAERVHYDKW